jgi:hypothetical protein
LRDRLAPAGVFSLQPYENVSPQQDPLADASSCGFNHDNSRNGTRSKTVLTEIGPVEIDVPRDLDPSFTPTIVMKRQRRLTGVDQPAQLVVRAPRAVRRSCRTVIRRASGPE